MNFLGEIYNKALLECDKNIKFWNEYLENLNALEFNLYSNKLTVPILVPIGNKIFFRGSLKHTNEVTVALGADYFTKCSIKQAEVLRLHRIKVAKTKLEELIKEKDYLESQLSFNKDVAQGSPGQDIVEICSEEEDKAWRKKHKEKVQQYYQNRQKFEPIEPESNDDELWSRLEELELQEELQNELESVDNEEEHNDNESIEYDSLTISQNGIINDLVKREHSTAKITHHTPKQTSKVNLLQQVIDRQNMLEEKLSELKNRDRVQNKTENDLIARLDELEQLDELEDEIDRLDDIIQEDVNVTVQNDENSAKSIKSVTFADEDESETMEIIFKHSNVEPSSSLYDAEKGIMKPSDVYEAYSTLFAKEATSILKKSKYDDTFDNNNAVMTSPEELKSEPNVSDVRTIVIQDVIEKKDFNGNEIENVTRPISLFKKKRLQQKS